MAYIMGVYITYIYIYIYIYIMGKKEQRNFFDNLF